MTSSTKIETTAAVVVTYNRKDLLRKCLNALLRQSHKLDSIIIVNNASTDGTEEMVKNEFLRNEIIDYVNLGENLGGSGGFHYGIIRAYEGKNTWIWCMDDDTIPYSNALEVLLEYRERSRILVPIVKNYEGRIEITLRGRLNKVLDRTYYFLKQDYENSEGLPIDFFTFVGVLLNREVVEAIGLPIRDFFIWHDDLEYSLRIRRKYEILMICDSVVSHPANVLNKDPKNNWKYVFGFRNRVYVLKHYTKFYYWFPYTILIFGKKIVYSLFIHHDLKELISYIIAYYQSLSGKFNNNIIKKCLKLI